MEEKGKEELDYLDERVKINIPDLVDEKEKKEEEDCSCETCSCDK